MADVEKPEGRRETLRYHRQYYDSHNIDDEKGWLSRPDEYLMKAAEKLPRGQSVRLLDIGAGPGRHAIPLAERCPAGSRIDAVDILPKALDQLRENADEAGLGNIVAPVCADIAEFPLPAHTYDAVFSCSSVEHVANAGILERVLRALAGSVRPGGLVCFLINTNTREIEADGRVHEALIEFDLDEWTARRLILNVFGLWSIRDLSTRPWRVTEKRGERKIVLASKCLRFTASKP